MPTLNPENLTVVGALIFFTYLWLGEHIVTGKMFRATEARLIENCKEQIADLNKRIGELIIERNDMRDRAFELAGIAEQVGEEAVTTVRRAKKA